MHTTLWLLRTILHGNSLLPPSICIRLLYLISSLTAPVHVLEVENGIYGRGVSVMIALICVTSKLNKF